MIRITVSSQARCSSRFVRQRAQQPAGRPAASRLRAPRSGGYPASALPREQDGVIYTDSLLIKNRIAKFNSCYQLNSEFQRQGRLTRCNARTTLETNQKCAGAGNAPITTRCRPRSINGKLKKDILRKARTRSTLQSSPPGTVYAVAGRDRQSARSFAKARGINVIIDAAQVPLLYAADSIDITRAFITEFNSKNPVTAATTTRRRSRATKAQKHKWNLCFLCFLWHYLWKQFSTHWRFKSSCRTAIRFSSSIASWSSCPRKNRRHKAGKY
jgi:hypothetical protein